LVDAVGWKPPARSQDAPDNGPLPRILHLAELLARLLADRQADALGELLEVGREYCRLTDAELQSLVASLQEKVAQLADVLKLQLPEGLDYRDVLVQAHAQLAATANEAAEDLLRGELPSRERLAEESLLSGVRDLQTVAERLSHAPSAAALPVPAAAVADALFAPAPAAAKWAAAAAVRVAPASASDELDQRLAVAVAACRQSRCALSLLLAELDRAEELAAARSPAEFAAIEGCVERACRELDHPFKICVPHGRHGFAIVLPNCERRQAVELGNALIDEFRRTSPGGDLPGRNGVSLSVGAAAVALPPRNFPPQHLFDGASRCLYGSHASGGGVVKSIEIY
jgi:GGDEF domain-containing protein